MKTPNEGRVAVAERSDRPLISICIPTYNRPSEFKRLLERLTPQLDERMELVVRDDSTNQDSVEIFEAITKQKKYASQYYKGEKIGVDAANLFLLQKANGRYIWWFSDDDILIEGGILAAIEIITRDPEINFIWVNFAYKELSDLVLQRSDGYFKNGSEVISTLGTNIGLMSTYIVKNDIARGGLDYAKKHIHGFSFAATAIVVWILTRPGNLYFLRGPYILCNPTSIGEFKNAYVKSNGDIENPAFDIYGVYFRGVIDGLAHHFDPYAVRTLLTLNFAALWRGMVVSWVGGWDTPKGKRIGMLKLYWNFPECWIALPIFCMPRKVVEFCYRIYKIFFRQRKFVFNEKFSFRRYK